MVCNHGKDGVRHEVKGEDSLFWWGGSETSPGSYIEGCAWSDYCNNFENSVRESFLSKQQICSM